MSIAAASCCGRFRIFDFDRGFLATREQAMNDFQGVDLAGIFVKLK
jgi:hypothetical protein